jgi:chorismate mutase/prephenate dehydrogenase
VSELEALRGRLDSVDEELVRLLARRAGVVREIWAWKRANGVGQVDPAREAALKARLLAQAEALGLSREAVTAVLERIVGKDLSARK